MNVLGRQSLSDVFFGRGGRRSIARGFAGAAGGGCFLVGVAVDLFLAGQESFADLLGAFAAISGPGGGAGCGQ